jgi:hypothetical protein
MAAPAPAAGPFADPVVVVTIDGVRWQEIFDGTEPARSHAPHVAASDLLPNLYALGTERGAFVGAPGRGSVEASGPFHVSLPGYTEIFGGRGRHDCASNDCARTTRPTWLDEASARGAKVAAFAAWTKVDLALTAEPGAFPVFCGPPSRQERLANPDALRSDEATARAALAYLQTERPDVLYLGLGDTDEYAHANDYPAYLRALRQADAVLGRLRAILARDERGGRTHVFVTADHGRAADFRNHGAQAESGRTWMVVSGPRITARGFVSSAEMRHLADLAPTARMLLGLDAPTSTRAHIDGDGAVLAELF